AKARRRAAKVEASPVDRAHDGARAELGRPAARLREGTKESLALRAFGAHPPGLDPDARDAETARLDQREHVLRALPRLGRAREVDAAQLDAVPADALGDAQHLRGGEARSEEHTSEL